MVGTVERPAVCQPLVETEASPGTRLKPGQAAPRCLTEPED